MGRRWRQGHLYGCRSRFRELGGLRRDPNRRCLTHYSGCDWAACDPIRVLPYKTRSPHIPTSLRFCSTPNPDQRSGLWTLWGRVQPASLWATSWTAAVCRPQASRTVDRRPRRVRRDKQRVDVWAKHDKVKVWPLALQKACARRIAVPCWFSTPSTKPRVRRAHYQATPYPTGVERQPCR